MQSSGVVNYPVTVAITNTTDAVKTGMTSNVNIIVAERDNVLTVPNRAIRTVGKQKTVTVLFEGQQIQTPVQAGLSGDSATEITSGLKEGDVVVLTTTTTRSTSERWRHGYSGRRRPTTGDVNEIQHLAGTSKVPATYQSEAIK